MIISVFARTEYSVVKEENASLTNKVHKKERN